MRRTADPLSLSSSRRRLKKVPYCTRSSEGLLLIVWDDLDSSIEPFASNMYPVIIGERSTLVSDSLKVA